MMADDRQDDEEETPLPPETDADRAFAAEMIRYNGARFDRDTPETDGEFYRIGWRLADGVPLPPDFPPGVRHELTDGAEGVQAWTDPRGLTRKWVYLCAGRVQIGGGHRRTARYLEETGLTARAAEEAHKLLDGRPYWRPGRVPPAARGRYIAAAKRLNGLRAVAQRFLPRNFFDPTTADLDASAEEVLGTFAEAITPADVEHLRASIRTAVEEGGEAYTAWAMGDGDPEMRALSEEIQALETAAALTPAERAARVAELLTGPDGTRHPDPKAWIDAAGWGRLRGVMFARLRDLAREETERALADTTDQLAESERKRRKLERKIRRTTDKLSGLVGRTIIPGQVIGSGYHPATIDQVLRDVERGELYAPPDALAALRQGAEFVVPHSPLGRLPAEQVRAMLAVFRLFSMEGDDGRELPAGPLCVPARLTYTAGGLSSSRDKDRRRLFDALRAVSSLEFAIALRLKANGQNAVVGERTAMFTMRPVWFGSTDKRRQLSDADAARIVAEWAAHGATDEPWTGALPDEYVFTLPTTVRMVWKRLVLNADVLERLDAGAKEVRGPTESFHGLEWRLFVELTQREQAGQRTDDGGRFRSYVDRDAVLLDFYGADKIEAARKAGKYRARYESQYDKAARVLEAADIARLETRDHKTASGELRDVYGLNPDVVLGTRARLANAAKKRGARAGCGKSTGRRSTRQPSAESGT